MNKSDTMYKYLAEHLNLSDIYAADAISTVSAFVFQSRKKLGLTQKEFAEKMNVSQGMISKWESANYNYTIESIAQIAAKLDACFSINFSAKEGNDISESAVNLINSNALWNVSSPQRPITPLYESDDAA